MEAAIILGAFSISLAILIAALAIIKAARELREKDPPSDVRHSPAALGNAVGREYNAQLAKQRAVNEALSDLIEEKLLGARFWPAAEKLAAALREALK